MRQISETKTSVSDRFLEELIRSILKEARPDCKFVKFVPLHTNGSQTGIEDQDGNAWIVDWFSRTVTSAPPKEDVKDMDANFTTVTGGRRPSLEITTFNANAPVTELSLMIKAKSGPCQTQRSLTCLKGPSVTTLEQCVPDESYS